MAEPSEKLQPTGSVPPRLKVSIRKGAEPARPTTEKEKTARPSAGGTRPVEPEMRDAHRELSQKGGELLEAGQYAEAETFYRKAADISRTPKILHRLGVIKTNQRSYDEGITLLKEAIRLQPNYAAAWGDLGIALHVAGRTDEAKTCLRKATELDRDDELSLRVLSDIERQEQKKAS